MRKEKAMVEKNDNVVGLYYTKRKLEVEIEEATKNEILPRRKAIEAINDALAFLCASEPVMKPAPKDPPPKKEQHPLQGARKSRSIPEEDIEQVLWEILSNVPNTTVRIAEQVAAHFNVRNTAGFRHKVCTILGSMPNVERTFKGVNPGRNFSWRRKG